MKVRAARRGFCWAVQLHLCQPRQQVPDPIPALSEAAERGCSHWVSLCQPWAEINASSWSLGSREQGGQALDPESREGRL